MISKGPAWQLFLRQQLNCGCVNANHAAAIDTKHYFSKNLIKIAHIRFIFLYGIIYFAILGGSSDRNCASCMGKSARLVSRYP